MALPPGPRASSLTQTVHWVRRPIAFLEECAARYGDCFTIRLYQFGDLVVLSHPETIRRIFTGNPEVLRAGEVATVLEPFVGKSSVLLLDGPEHLRQRRLMLPSFHGERMMAYATAMREVSERDVAGWPRGEVFALHPHMQAITLEVIMRTVFGVEDAARMERLGTRLTAVIDFGASGAALLPFVSQIKLGPRSPRVRFEALKAAADEAVYEELARRRRDGVEAGRTDVLSMMMAAVDEHDQTMSDRELRDELMTLLSAGHETTATALAWTLERVLSHRDVHERLVAEVRGVVGDGPVAAEHLPRLEYLDAVIKEALRLRPIIPMVGRRLQVPLQVRGFDLPAGVVVAPNIYLTHHNPEVYPEPTRFRPERFLGVKPDPYAWLPFGGGIRRCLGMAFALYEMKIVLATVLASVDLGLAPGSSARLRRRGITFAPADGVRVVMRGRRERVQRAA